MELTRTSANHLANMAKEAYQQEETTLTNISFVSTSIELLDSTCVKVIKKGKTLDDLLKFKTSLTKISKYKYLIAYLRESIKSLDEEEKSVSRLYLNDFEKAMNLQPLEAPVEKYAPKPKKSLKILKNEAYASTFGKFIHEHGNYDNARTQALNAQQNPTSVDYNGKDSILTTSTLTVDLHEIDQVFFDLQKTQRHYQSTLNKELFDNEQAERLEQERLDEEVRLAQEEYWKQRDIRSSQFSAWKKEKLEEVRLKKILVPDELIPIVEEIKALM
jgi:hypothetical protein